MHCIVQCCALSLPYHALPALREPKRLSENKSCKCSIMTLALKYMCSICRTKRARDSKKESTQGRQRQRQRGQCLEGCCQEKALTAWTHLAAGP